MAVKKRREEMRDMNGLMLFPFRFFLLGSGRLAHAGHALIVNLCALLRVLVQGRLQGLSGCAWFRPLAQRILFAHILDHIEEAAVSIELVALIAGPGDLPMVIHHIEFLRVRTGEVVTVDPFPLLPCLPQALGPEAPPVSLGDFLDRQIRGLDDSRKKVGKTFKKSIRRVGKTIKKLEKAFGKRVGKTSVF